MFTFIVLSCYAIVLIVLIVILLWCIEQLLSIFLGDDK